MAKGLRQLEPVSDPLRVVTDGLLLKELERQGIDKRFVEYSEPYHASHPTAKFYKDLKSDKRFAVLTAAPKVNSEGRSIEPKWRREVRAYIGEANTFGVGVQNRAVRVAYKDKRAQWSPQVFIQLPGLDWREVFPSSEEPALLYTDPVNPNYHYNVLEWDYGICKRRLRLIEGGLIERYIFFEAPEGNVKIKSNWKGEIKAARNWAKDAQHKELKVITKNDEEIIKAEEFGEPQFYKTYPNVSFDDTELGRIGKWNGCGLCGTWDFVAGRNLGKSLDDVKRLVDKWMDRILDGEVRFALDNQIPVECGYELTKKDVQLTHVSSSLRYPIIVASSPETFYPAVDGHAYMFVNNETWANLHDGVGNNFNKTFTYFYVWIQAGTIADKWAVLYRGLLSFLTSSIPAATITDATLTLYGREKLNQFDPPPPAINIYGTELVSPISIEAGDYDGVLATPFSSNIAYLNFDVNPITPAPNEFIFNQTGKDWINKDGYTELSVREAINDAGDVAPAWANAKKNYFVIASTEAGSPYVPKLIITYVPKGMLAAEPKAKSQIGASVDETSQLETSVGEKTQIQGSVDEKTEIQGSVDAGVQLQCSVNTKEE